LLLVLAFDLLRAALARLARLARLALLVALLLVAILLLHDVAPSGKPATVPTPWAGRSCSCG
jgi:hypothetical protein